MLQKLTEITKNCEKDTLRGFKVTEFVTNQNSICDFLIMVNSNLGRILHAFGATVTHWSEITSGTCPSHLTPSLMVTPCEYVDEPYIAKN